MNAYFASDRPTRRNTGKSTESHPGAAPIASSGSQVGGQVEGGEFARSSLLLTQALTTAHGAPDVRQDKVAILKARLLAGEYEIDSRAIAEALVRENPGLFASL